MKNIRKQLNTIKAKSKKNIWDTLAKLVEFSPNHIIEQDQAQRNNGI